MRVLGIAAACLVALALVPAGAHLFEMPNKLRLSPERYMLVQQIYRGWALFGLVVIPALLLTFSYAAVLYRRSWPYGWALAGFLCMALGHAIFWLFTYPANAVTENWTRFPGAFEAVRMQWELSHAANALLTAMALLCMLNALVQGVRASVAPAAQGEP